MKQVWSGYGFTFCVWDDMWQMRLQCLVLDHGRRRAAFGYITALDMAVTPAHYPRKPFDDKVRELIMRLRPDTMPIQLVRGVS